MFESTDPFGPRELAYPPPHDFLVFQSFVLLLVYIN